MRSLNLPLPKVNHPTFPILVPSLGHAARFRPFVVREEKILLMARESGDPVDHLRAVHQVVTNCLEDSDGTIVDRLTIFDLEWLFLKLRESSVGPTVPASFTDNEEREAGLDPLPKYDFTIKLADVHPPETAGYDGEHTISLASGDGVVLQYPPASLYKQESFVKDSGNSLLHASTKRIFSTTETFDAKTCTLEEVVEYYEGWGVNDMQLVKEFIDTMPTMSYSCEYVNSYGHARKVRLTGLTDFFSF